MEPGVEKEDMLGEAEDLLEASLVQLLPSIISLTWRLPSH